MKQGFPRSSPPDARGFANARESKLKRFPSTKGSPGERRGEANRNAWCFSWFRAQPCCLAYVPRTFVLIRYGQVTYTETTAIERRPKREVMPHDTGPCGEAPPSVRRRKEERIWPRAFSCFPREGMGEAG